jgi:hypothetical protein
LIDVGRDIVSLAISPDGGTLAATSAGGSFHLVDIVTGERRLDATQESLQARSRRSFRMERP